MKSTEHQLELDSLLVDPETRALVDRAIGVEGCSLVDFIRMSVRERALETLTKHTVIQLTAEDQLQIAKALSKPPEFNQEMHGAFGLRDQLIEGP